MRWMVWLVVAFAVAVGAALLMHFNHGNVAVLWPPYRIELSVNLALVLLALAFGLLHLTLVAMARAKALPQRVRDYRSRRAQEQAVASLRDGVLAFFEGRLGRAERFAQAAQANPSTRSAAALVAARSAHRMQETARRDRWLEAAQGDPAAENALLMTQAELAVEDRRTPEALALLERLHARGARHILSLRTALRAYEQAGRWADVLHTLRLVEKRDALHPAAVRRLRSKAFDALVGDRAGDGPGLRDLWRTMRPEERQLPELASRIAVELAAAGAVDDARRIVEQSLDAGYDERLAVVYARLGGLPLRDRLERLETWRQRYGDEAGLLLALGGVCSAEKLWGKAEEYLRLAVQREPSVAACAALGELYEALGRPQEAADAFREAARRALAAPPAATEPTGS